MLTSGALSVAQLALIWGMSSEAMGEVTDKPGWRYTGATIMTSCYANLIWDGVFKTPVRIFDQAVAYFKGRFRKPIGYHLMPKLYAGLRVLSLGTAGLSYGPTAELCDRYYKGNTRITMQVACCSAVILLVGNAMGDLVDDITEAGASRLKDPESKLLLRLKKKTDHFVRLIRKSQLVEFAKFLKVLPEKDFGAWLQRLKISRDQLTQYISTHSTSDKTISLLEKL